MNQYRRSMLVLLGFFLILGCAAQGPKGLDPQADERLGLEAEEDIQEAQQTIQEMQEKYRQEQRQQLQRQITDPTF